VYRKCGRVSIQHLINGLVGSLVIVMNMETARARLAQVQALNLRRDFYFAIDALAICIIFVTLSYLTWGSFEIWLLPEVALPAVTLVISLPLVKITVLRNETDRVRRLAKLHTGIIIAYALLSAYLLLSREYYSRLFITSSFIALMVWQVIDTLFLSAGIRPQLVAVPSSLVDQIRALPGSNIAVLRQPILEGPTDGVVVDLHEALTPEWQKFIAECAASGVNLYHAAIIYESYSGRIPLSRLGQGILDILGGPKAYRHTKRLLDVVLVLLSLPVVLPVCLILALIIKLDSPGPALYWQERVGEHGKPFKMVKFRSMKTDAEAEGPRFASTSDPRVTRVGRVIRKYRLDEIPQLWNVLRGEMSLIGPRPEQVAFAKMFEKEIPFYAWRHLVKPGITGWAQVQDGYAADIDDTIRKIEYDLYYIKHLSFWLDLSILIRTVGTVLTGNGAR